MSESYLVQRILGSTRRFLLFVAIISLFLLTGVGMAYLFGRTTDKPEILPAVPTLNEDDDQTVGDSELQTLTVNAQLEVNGQFYLAPTQAPQNAKAGTLIFDQDTSTLQYFNGTSFVPLTQQAAVPQGGVTSFQGQTGAITLTPGGGITLNGTTISNSGILGINGVAGNISVTTANGIASLSLPQSIAPTASPVFSGLTLSSALGVTSGGTGASTFNANSVIIGNGTGALTSVAAVATGQCLLSTAGAPTFGACAGGGSGVDSVNTLTGNLTIANSSGVGTTITIDDASTAQKGIAQFNSTNFTAVAGVVNTVQNISTTSSPTFGGLTLTSPLTVANGGTGRNSLTSNSVLVGNGAGQVQQVTAAGAGECLVSTAGAPIFTACPGAGGVASIDGQTGTVLVNNATGSGGTITIDDASTTQKGIAQFNSTNFSVVGGIVNSIQGISTTATPTFADLTLTAPLAVTSGGTGANSAASARSNLGAAGSGANSDITSTTALNSITPSAALTVGAAAQSFTLQGTSASVITGRSGANITTVGFAAPTASATINFPALSAGTYTICTSANNCTATGVTSLNTFSGAVTVQGTANRVTVNNAAGTITLSTPQDINTTSSPTFSGLTLTTLTIGGDTVNEFAGTGLQVVANALQTTLGTSVDLTAEVTGVLPIANGGTNANNAASARTNLGAAASGANSDITSTTALNTITPSASFSLGATSQSFLLQGNASATITATSGSFTTTLGFVTPTANATINLPALSAGTYQICTTSGNCLGGSGGANTALSNLASVAINTSLLPGAATIDLGSGVNPFRDLYIGGTATNNFRLTGSASAARTITFPDATGTVCLSTGNCSGSGFSVTSVNSLQGVLTIQGTANEVQITDNASDTITVGLPDDVTVADALTVTGLASVNGGLTVQSGDTFTFNNEAFTDLTGNGLAVSVGVLGVTVQANKGLEVDANGVSLIDCNNNEILKYSTGTSQWGCAVDNGASYTAGNDLDLTAGQFDIESQLDFVQVINRTSANLTLQTTTSGDILVNAAGSFNVGAGDLVVNASGNTTVGGTLGVTGATTLTSTLSVEGNVTLGNLNTDTVTFNSGTSGVGIRFADGTFASCTALETDAEGDLTCGTDADTNTTYSAGNDLDLTGTTFDIESQLDFVTTINQTSANLTLQTTTTGDILVNAAGSFNVGAGDLVVNASGNTTIGGTLGVTGASTFTGLATFNGNLTVQTGDTFTINGDAFTDLTGTGLQVNTGSLEATLGTSVDLTSEVTGTLPIANGGTNATSAQAAINNLSGLTTNGDLLYHNGTNSIRLARGADSQCLTSNTTTIIWGSCGASGDNITINGAAATDANFINTAVTGTVAGVTWAINTTPTPDEISLTVSNASATEAGVVTTSAQTFAGNKTFNNDLTVSGATVLQTTLGVTGNATFDTSTLFVDAANNQVSIGTTSNLGAKLAVVGSSDQEQLLIRAAAGQTYANPLILAQNSDGSELWRIAADPNENLFFGRISGGSSVSGIAQYNVGFGTRAAGAISDGDQNTAIGYQALRDTTVGSSNTALGFQAGANLVDGSNNIYIGNGISASATNVSNELRIGGVLQGNTSTFAAQFNGTLGVTGATTLTSSLSVEGNTTIGNGNADTLTINAGTSGTGLRFVSFVSCTALETDAQGDLVCGTDDGGAGGGDNITINGAAATDANFINTAVTGTVAGVTWAINTTPTPDEISLTVSNASATEAGVVTTSAQTFAGDKSFNGALSVSSTATFNGNVVVGNSNADTITFNAGISGTGIRFSDSSFASCTALETDANGDLTCGTDGDTTYTAGNDIDITAGQIDIESQLDFVSVINQTSANLTLQTTTSGDILVNSAGSFNVGSGDLVVDATGNTSIGGTLAVSSTASFNGNVVVGNSNADTITFNAGISGTGIRFSDSSFASCTALETDANGDLTCGTDGDTTYTAGNDIDINGTDIDIESQLDFVSVMNQTSANLTLQTTTSGDILVNAAGSFNVGAGDLVVDASGNTTIGGTLGVTGAATFTSTLSVEGNVTLGNANTDTVTFTAGTSGAGIRLADGTFASCTALETDAQGDITCGSDDGGTAYTAGNDLDLTAGQFDIESQLDFVTTINQTSANLTLQTTTTGDILVNAAGSFNVGAGDLVVNASGNTTVGGTLGVTGATTLTSTLSVEGNVTLGNANTDTVTFTAGTSGAGIRLADGTFASCTALETDAEGDLTCGTDADTNTTYSAGNDLDLTGTTFDIESQLDFVTTINQTSANLTLQTTTTGDILVNAAGSFNVGAGDLVVNASGNTTVGGTLTVTGLGTFNTGLTVATGSTFTNASSSLFTAIAISDVAAGGNIGTAAATVDVATTFNVNQTTASQTLTLPSPTTTTSGRIAYVNNVGSASFTMYSQTIAAGSSASFIWNGTAWTPASIDTDTDTNTTYSAGNDLDLTGTTFDIEAQLDSVTTINQTSANLTLQTTTTGDILVNAAGSFNVGAGDLVVNASGNTTIGGTLGVTGLTTLSGGLTVTNGGNVAFQKGTDYSTVGSANDVNFGTGVLFRLTGASAQTITGIAGGADGRILTLVNAGSTSATISNNSGSSVAANRIITGTGADLSVAAGASVSLVYDTTASLWRAVGTSSAGGSPVAGNDIDVTGNTIDIESQLDFVTTINQTSANLTLQTTTSGDILLNAAGSFNVGAGDLVVDATGNTTIGGTLGVTGASTFTGLATFNGNLTVQTGDTFTFNGDAFTDFTGGGLVNSAGVLSVDTTSATGFFRNGGNSFGATAVLGTNDSNSLSFKTNNVTQATIAVGGAATFQNSTNSTAGLKVNSSGGTDVLTVDTTNSQTILRGINSDAVIGSELIVSQDFTNATYWNNSTGWTETTTSATHTTGNTTALTATATNITVTAGATYQIVFTVASNSTATNTVTPRIGGVNGPVLGANATHTVVITASNTTALTFINPSTNFNGTISNVSVKLITLSNAAIQVKNSSGTVALEVRASGTTSNTFIGLQAGQSNTTGNYNTANGSYSLRSNTTGYYNTANGAQSLSDNTTGYYNTANGVSSLKSNTTGYDNTANGAYSLSDNTTGYRNTANGLNSLRYNTTGNGNTALGFQAGYNSGVSLQTNSNSVFLGSDANTSVDGLTNVIAIGYQAQATQSNQLVVNGVTSGYFGNGVTNAAPSAFTLNATGGSGTDIAGANLLIAGGRGTGTGVGGSLLFQIAKPGTTGASANSLATVLTLSGTNGSATFQNSTNSTTAFAVQNAAGTSIMTLNTASPLLTVSGDILAVGLNVSTYISNDGNTTLGDENADTLTVNAGTSGTGIRFSDPTFASCTALETDASGDLTCGSDADTTYTAGNDIDITAGQVDIESQLDFVSVINQTSANLTLQTTTSGDILLNAAGSFNVGAGDLVVNASGNTTVGGTLTVGNVLSATNITIGTSDTTGTLLVLDTKTDATDPAGVNGAMYYNSNAGKFRCYEGGSWKDCITTAVGGSGTGVIKLAPEFTNSTIFADGTNNSGTLSASYQEGLSAGEGYKHTYYQWETSQATAQDYNIVVAVQLPSDYVSGLGSITFWHRDPDGATTNANTTLTIKDVDGTQCVSTAYEGTTSNVWEQESVTIGGCTFAANDIITFSFQVKTTTAAGPIRLGEFKLEYTR